MIRLVKSLMTVTCLLALGLFIVGCQSETPPATDSASEAEVPEATDTPDADTGEGEMSGDAAEGTGDAAEGDAGEDPAVPEEGGSKIDFGNL